MDAIADGDLLLLQPIMYPHLRRLARFDISVPEHNITYPAVDCTSSHNVSLRSTYSINLALSFQSSVISSLTVVFNCLLSIDLSSRDLKIPSSQIIFWPTSLHTESSAHGDSAAPSAAEK